MPSQVVITGVGLVTPLGCSPPEVLRQIEAHIRATAPPRHFHPFACQLGAQVPDFDARAWVPDPKLLKLMNREAQFAVAAASLALRDARLVPNRDYAADQIALYGATGLTGLPLHEAAPLVKCAAAPDGTLDLRRFASEGLRGVNPLLSFKILPNMPVCFVSICCGIEGPNAIYTPWEGQGAQAIVAAIRALERGHARCALAGGTDVKTHELAYIHLEQRGLFRSWSEEGRGLVPGEGAGFVVLETSHAARQRGVEAYAEVAGFGVGSSLSDRTRAEACLGALQPIQTSNPAFLLSASEDDQASQELERSVLAAAGIRPSVSIAPKPCAGNLFAAATALQLGLGAVATRRLACHQTTLVHCFGEGTEQGAFWLRRP